MNRRLRQVSASALGIFVLGYALWPPGHVYWESVAAFIGTVPTMVLVLLLAGLAGAGIVASSDVALSSHALGGGIAYAIGMALIEVTVSPISPVHLYLYGGILLSVLLGAAAAGYRTDNDAPAY